jgi:hypothetical protein
MFPANATSVMPVMRIDHSSAGVVLSPSNWLKMFGVITRAIALKPNTLAPTRNTFLNLFVMWSNLVLF